jgi:hypothetical protein
VSRVQQARRLARRSWPVILAAWQRWQSLPEHEKERYRKMARDYAGRGRKALDDARRRRRG